MTRIFTDGAEMYDSLFFSSGAPSVSNTVYASGAYSYYNMDSVKTISPISELYFKQRVRGGWNATKYLIGFRNSTTVLGYVSNDALNRWVIGTSTGTVLDTATEVAINLTWYCMEVYFKLDDAAGVFTLKIDGNTVCTFSGDTKPGAAATVDNLVWQRGGAGDWWIDDLALNDTAGGADDSWIGGGRIIKVTPDGNGSTTEWTGSDGNAVDNYLLVDEYPYDSDTTYVYEDASATGDLDQYTLSDYDGTDRTITRIWAEARARKTAADAATLKIGFDTGASVNTDDVGTLYETYSIRCVGAEYKVNPDDAAAFEEADIDSMEFVAEVG